MGLLGDLINQGHQDKATENKQKYDAYKTIIGSPEATHEGKEYALGQILQLTGKGKGKGAELMPIFKHLLGIHTDKDKQMGNPPPYQPPSPQPYQANPPTASGAPSKFFNTEEDAAKQGVQAKTAAYGALPNNLSEDEKKELAYGLKPGGTGAPIKIVGQDENGNPVTRLVNREGKVIREDKAPAKPAKDDTPAALKTSLWARKKLNDPNATEEERATASEVLNKSENDRIMKQARLQVLRKQIETANMTKSPQSAAVIAEGVKQGIVPPDLTGVNRDLKGMVIAKLAKDGVNLTQLTQAFKAEGQLLRTLNGNQQTRMRQALGTAKESLDVIDDLADQWHATDKQGRIVTLNKANLALAKEGLYGDKPQQIATQLEEQISDVTSELGQVYMGGNSPTDRALGLASNNLSSNWSIETLKAATKLARTNLGIRESVMNNPTVVGGSPLYTPGGGGVTGQDATTPKTPPPPAVKPQTGSTGDSAADAYLKKHKL